LLLKKNDMKFLYKLRNWTSATYYCTTDKITVLMTARLL